MQRNAAYNLVRLLTVPCACHGHHDALPVVWQAAAEALTACLRAGSAGRHGDMQQVLPAGCTTISTAAIGILAQMTVQCCRRQWFWGPLIVGRVWQRPGWIFTMWWHLHACAVAAPWPVPGDPGPAGVAPVTTATIRRQRHAFGPSLTRQQARAGASTPPPTLKLHGRGHGVQVATDSHAGDAAVIMCVVCVYNGGGGTCQTMLQSACFLVFPTCFPVICGVAMGSLASEGKGPDHRDADCAAQPVGRSAQLCVSLSAASPKDTHICVVWFSNDRCSGSKCGHNCTAAGTAGGHAHDNRRGQKRPASRPAKVWWHRYPQLINV